MWLEERRVWCLPFEQEVPEGRGRGEEWKGKGKGVMLSMLQRGVGGTLNAMTP